MGHAIRGPLQVELLPMKRVFPRKLIQRILDETGRGSVRVRQLPAELMMYYIIALGLWISVGCREVLRRLLDGSRLTKLSSESAITQARQRLGAEPVKQLHDEVVGPVATPKTREAWYKKWRIVTIDGSTVDVADSKANEEAFGRPPASRGSSAYPQVRFVSLLENSTHVLFGTEIGPCSEGEQSLAVKVFSHLEKGMICIADRNYFGFDKWTAAAATGAALLWRMKSDILLPRMKQLKDGSYLTQIYGKTNDRRYDRDGTWVRVVEYVILPKGKTRYRLMTTILDPTEAPAKELAQLYSERWTIETAFEELKTRFKAGTLVLRSKSPELITQDIYGLLLAHFAVRSMMHDAALEDDLVPSRLSFVHSVRVIHRRMPYFVSFSPSAENASAPRVARGTP